MNTTQKLVAEENLQHTLRKIAAQDAETLALVEASLYRLAAIRIDPAIEKLIKVGEDCKRCGWEADRVLWCTDGTSITAGILWRLKELVESSNTPLRGQTEQIAALDDENFGAQNPPKHG